MAAAFALALESDAVGRPAARLLKSVGLGKVPVPDEADLSDYLGRLRAHLDEGAGLAEDVRSLFEKSLIAAARLPLGRPQVEGACETLRRAGHDQARLAFAEAALKRWPGAPVFELHLFEAKQAGRRRYPSDADLARLEDAFAQAQEAGDQRTAHRIGECLAEFSPFAHLGGGYDPFAEDDDEAADVDLDQFGIDPDTVLRTMVEMMGVDRVLKMAGIVGKERAQFKQLERELGREGAAEVLVEMLRKTLPDFAGGPLPGFDPAPKGFPTPGGRIPIGLPKPGAAKGKSGGKRPAPAAPDNDEPEQFELF
jgi:hypothetical protein